MKRFVSAIDSIVGIAVVYAICRTVYALLAGECFYVNCP